MLGSPSLSGSLGRERLPQNSQIATTRPSVERAWLT